ncbi:MAG: hypothetical protein JW990_15710 [Thermoleophilia bacterium]|nr:hypothetical protein [Thermoleophilia bacterium]
MKRLHSTSWFRALLGPLTALLLTACCLVWTSGCDLGGGEGAEGRTTSTTEEEGQESGDIAGVIGEAIKVGQATVTVRALHSTFQPASPEQRLSEKTPTAPGAGETFYQAYVRVTNTDVTPLRIDPEDFVCRVADSVVAIEPTRSGPFPRSLLNNTSLDLMLTFRAAAGYLPMLIYTPPWYDGIITVTPEAEETTTTSTQ